MASRKIERLTHFGPKLKVVAPQISAEIVALSAKCPIELVYRVYEPNDLVDTDIVIVAVDDISLQKQIFEIASQKRIPCNAVDSPDYCSFIFPALVFRGEMTIGVSTGGKAPGLSAAIRKEIDEYLPKNLNEILQKVQAFRGSTQLKAEKAFNERAKLVTELVSSLLGDSKK